jgi:SAM-dependent methyltransferase
MSEDLRACPLCEAADFQELFVTRDQHFGGPGWHRVVQCANCSVVFLNPRYSDQELAAVYPSDYYAYQDNFRRPRWKKVVKGLLGYQTGPKDPHFESPGTVLDLGCGSGWFLQEMRARGWMAYGVEISKAASLLGESQGLQIFWGTVQQANFRPEFFDYVRANHSFEHMTCPNETLDEIYRILKPQGRLLIGVPNIDGLNARVFKRHWWHLCAPVHPFHYSVKTLSRLLARHHFSIERISYDSDYAGILGSLQILCNRNNHRKSSEGMLINNIPLRLICHSFAKSLDLIRMGDVIEITARKVQKEA